jgi:hypothetical protein
MWSCGGPQRFFVSGVDGCSYTGIGCSYTTTKEHEMTASPVAARYIKNAALAQTAATAEARADAAYEAEFVAKALGAETVAALAGEVAAAVAASARHLTVVR